MTKTILLGLLVLGLGNALADRPVSEEMGSRMTLRGEGLLRVGYLFKVYEARLFVQENAPTADVLTDVAKRLEIRYLRPIKAADIIEIGDQTLQRQVGPEQLQQIQDRVATINSWYADVRPGDIYTLTYVPGQGSELALNGKSLGTIEGADFAAAYFGIWLDHRTKYTEFRNALLGGSG